MTQRRRWIARCPTCEMIQRIRHVEYSTSVGGFESSWLVTVNPWFHAGRMMCWRRTGRTTENCWVSNSYITHCIFKYHLTLPFVLPARYCPSKSKSDHAYLPESDYLEKEPFTHLPRAVRVGSHLYFVQHNS